MEKEDINKVVELVNRYLNKKYHSDEITKYSRFNATNEYIYSLYQTRLNILKAKGKDNQEMALFLERLKSENNELLGHTFKPKNSTIGLFTDISLTKVLACFEVTSYSGNIDNISQ